jgi:dnd system-associated protein 4
MRRIRRDKKHEEFIQSLRSGEQPVFKDIWQILLFAATLGAKANKRTPIDNFDGQKAFPENYFNTPAWRGILYLIGFCENEGTDHLRNEEEEQEKLITAFEEYANYGLGVMAESLGSTTDPLGEVIEFILNQTQEELEAPDLGGLL